MLDLIEAADGIMTDFYTEYGYNLLALIPALVHMVIFNAMFEWHASCRTFRALPHEPKMIASSFLFSFFLFASTTAADSSSLSFLLSILSI